MHRIILASCILNLAFLSPAVAETNDYIRGYVSAIVHDESKSDTTKAVEIREMEVQPNGEITLDITPCLSNEQNKRIHDRLLASRIITNIKWKDTTECATEVVVVEDKTPLDKFKSAEFLPEMEIFQPVQADSHESRFSLNYLYYQTNDSNDSSFNLGYITAGDTFPLVGWDYQENGQLQLGLEGGVFALFNLDERSNDLVNADYILGIPLMYRNKDFSMRARIFHQSSHLGDEFLINNPEVERVNYSYEELELLGSYDWHGFRLIAGGGRIVNSEPNLDPWTLKSGLEFRSPDIIGDLDLLLAGLISSTEDLDWNISQSYKMGLAMQRSGNREIQLILQFYNGFSPNGQFYEDRVEYIGLGVFFDS